MEFLGSDREESADFDQKKASVDEIMHIAAVIYFMLVLQSWRHQETARKSWLVGSLLLPQIYFSSAFPTSADTLRR